MLTLICGVGRAGKSTYSQKFNYVIHLDLMGCMPERYENVIKEIESIDRDVVVEGIYDRPILRKNLIKAYSGAKKICIWFNTPEEIVKKRMEKTGICMTRRHMFFIPPTYDEGWDEIIEIKEPPKIEGIGEGV